MVTSSALLSRARSVLKGLVLSSVLFGAAPALAEADGLSTGLSGSLAGYDRFGFSAHHRAGLVEGSVWYPPAAKTYPAPIGDGPVFRPAQAWIGADIADGRHPLVLVSHGSGGNMDGLGWLSSELARRGAMVVAVNHPGSTSGDSSPRRSARFADRVRDLSAVLDHVLQDPDFGGHVDRDRIHVLGFSLGGISALQAVGLEFRARRLGLHCAKDPSVPGCDFYCNGGVDFRHADISLTDGAYADKRIQGVIAVDPGFPFGFTQESIARMEKPALLINLGSQETIWPEVNMGELGAGWEPKFPNATLVEISPATHFSFLAVCKPGGAQILLEEEDDPVCSEPTGADRAAVHAQVIKAVSRFLELKAP